MFAAKNLYWTIFIIAIAYTIYNTEYTEGEICSEMDPQIPNLGGSLQVPLVQELAKEKPATVPSRYVREDQQQNIVDRLSSSPKIPVIDFGKLSTDSEIHLLHTAARDWGFFQLTNHEVDPEVVDRMKFELQHFFNLSSQEKMMFTQKPGDVEGYGQIFVISEEQKLDWGDMFYFVSSPAYLRKPYLLPKLPSTFRDAIEAYSTQVSILTMKILEAMARGLCMEVEDMKTLFEEAYQSMRMNYYPPCPQPELVTGLAPHSDASALTILLQVNEVEGLQIKKDGAWIPVSPLPNAFVINIGDMLEVITNGIYQSIEHRATVNSDKPRLSVATFMQPKFESDFGPAPSLINHQTPARFKKTSVAEYLKGFFSRELAGKSFLDSMRI